MPSAICHLPFLAAGAQAPPQAPRLFFQTGAKGTPGPPIQPPAAKGVTSGLHQRACPLDSQVAALGFWLRSFPRGGKEGGGRKKGQPVPDKHVMRVGDTLLKRRPDTGHMARIPKARPPRLWGKTLPFSRLGLSAPQPPRLFFRPGAKRTPDPRLFFSGWG